MVRDAEIDAVEVEKVAEDQGKKVFFVIYSLTQILMGFLGAHLPEEN